MGIPFFIIYTPHDGTTVVTVPENEAPYQQYRSKYEKICVFIVHGPSCAGTARKRLVRR
jgi:hypothetical protein